MQTPKTTGGGGLFGLLCLLCLAALAAVSCGGTRPGPTPPDPLTPLKDAATSTGRTMGTAMAYQHLSEAAYVDTVLSDFNSITPENEMKWDAIEPSSGVFAYDAADALVAFAEQNGLRVRGHTLVWYLQLPSWVMALTDANDVRNAMINHITEIVTHYRGRVAAWDVVNETWENGTTMRSSVFFQYLGPGYVDEAFQAARAADPSAQLYYNDYAAEGMSAKANAVYTMVADMKARGVPIDGVGMQMHTSATGGPMIPALTTNMERLAALGLDIEITEMDVHICASDLDGQRSRYHDIVATCVGQQRCRSVTVWGITDKYSWLNNADVGCTAPRPLLFDDAYAKKPAYRGVMDALLGL